MTTSARQQSALLADLLRREHVALAEFLVALAEFDRRRVWLELGHASLFAFLNRELGLSAGAAFYRKTAAELLQKFPEVVEPLRDGRLCFTSIVELSKNLTPENRDQVLPRFFHVSKREAKALTAELRPVEDVPRRDVVTTVRAAAVAPALALATRDVPSDPGSDQAFHPDETAHANSEPPTQEIPRSKSMTEEPKTASLTRLHITVSRGFLKKLEDARAALSHSHPGASGDEVLEAGLDLLLERHAKRRGLVEKPRKTPPPAKGDCIPAHVKRAVWLRDGGRCQWKLDSGGICGSTHKVQLDHLVPRARGGPPTVANLRCLCRVHNDLAARQVYGDAWMERFTGRAGIPRAEEPAARYPSASRPSGAVVLRLS